MHLEYAAQFVNYDPLTGQFTWRERDPSLYERWQSAVRFNNTFAGKRASSLCNFNGYHRINIRLNGSEKCVLAHRLAWFIYYGEYPEKIDHINGCRQDNRICNLRSVSSKQNNQNKGISKRNTSGRTGVSFCNTRKKWCAKGFADGKRKHLGYFTEKQEAIDARVEFENEMGYHPNHGVRNGWVRHKNDQ